MRLMLLIATPFLVAALGAAETSANPTNPDSRASGVASRETPELVNFFSNPGKYFLQRFVQAASSRMNQLVQTARLAQPSSTAKKTPPVDNFAFGEDSGPMGSLSLHYEGDDLSLSAGKYSPSFGISPAFAANAFSAEFTREYEQNGRVGLGGAWEFDAGGESRHALSLNSYFFESALLNSAAWQSEYQSTPAETLGISTLRSLSAALDGGIEPSLPNLSYHLAARYQSWGEAGEAGDGNVTEELGYVAALHGKIKLANGTIIDPVLEYAHFDDDGQLRLERQYLTLGITGDQGPWNMSLIYSSRDSKPLDPLAEHERQRLFQLMLRYDFADGSTVDLGHRRDGAGDTASKNLNVRFDFPL